MRLLRPLSTCMGLLLLLAMPIAAAGPVVDPSAPLDRNTQCDRVDCGGANTDTDGTARVTDDARADRLCQSVTFRVNAAADVTMGTLIGGPYNGFPVVVVEPTGTGGVPLNAATAVPAAYTRYQLTTASGATVGGFVDGGAGRAAPFAVFFAKQSLPAGGLYTTDRNAQTYTAKPDLVILSGCE